MKNIIYILLSATMLTSCVGVKNTINRASVEDGESFVKYGIDGYPDGIEVHKGSECLKTDAEIRRFNRQWERQERKERKEKEKEEKEFMERLDRITEEFHKNYLENCCND